MFGTREDGNLELLTRGLAPKHPVPIYEKTPYYSVNPSTSGGAYSGLNPYAGSYYLPVMTSQGRPIGKTILQSLDGASSSLSSGATPDRDSLEYYPKIGGSACSNPDIDAHCISMVGPARGNSQNNSSKYPTIGGSKASNARTPNNTVVPTLNPSFNTMRFQMIMKSIQWMVPPDSPLVALAQQGVEAANKLLQQHHQPETIRVSLSSVTDRTIRINGPKVKRHHRPVTIGVWLTTLHVGG
jgi:hypothetical protein